MKHFALQYAINQDDYQIIRHQTAETDPTAILKLLLSPLFFNKQYGLNSDTTAIGYIEDDTAYCLKQAIAKTLATNHHQIIQKPHFIHIKPLTEQQKKDDGITYEDGYPLLANAITDTNTQAENQGFDKASQDGEMITLYAECAMMLTGPMDHPVMCEMLTVYRLGSNSTGFTLDKNQSETLAMTQGDSGQVNTGYFIIKVENLDYLELDLTNLDGTITIASHQNDLTTSLQQAMDDNNASEAVNVLTDNTPLVALLKDETGLFEVGLSSGQKQGNQIVSNKIIISKNEEGKLVIADGNVQIAKSEAPIHTMIMTVQQKATAADLQPEFTLKRLGCLANPQPAIPTHGIEY